MKWEAKAMIHYKKQRTAVWSENNSSVNARFNFNAINGLNRVIIIGYLDEDPENTVIDDKSISLNSL